MRCCSWACRCRCRSPLLDAWAFLRSRYHGTCSIRPTPRRSASLHSSNVEPRKTGRPCTKKHHLLSPRRVAKTPNRPPHRTKRRANALEDGVGAIKGEYRPTSPRAFLRAIRLLRFAKQHPSLNRLPRPAPNERSSIPALSEASPDSHEAEHAQQTHGGWNAARSVTAYRWRVVCLGWRGVFWSAVFVDERLNGNLPAKFSTAILCLCQ